MVYLYGCSDTGSPYFHDQLVDSSSLKICFHSILLLHIVLKLHLSDEGVELLSQQRSNCFDFTLWLKFDSNPPLWMVSSRWLTTSSCPCFPIRRPSSGDAGSIAACHGLIQPVSSLVPFRASSWRSCSYCSWLSALSFLLPDSSIFFVGRPFALRLFDSNHQKSIGCWYSRYTFDSPIPFGSSSIGLKLFDWTNLKIPLGFHSVSTADHWNSPTSQNSYSILLYRSSTTLPYRPALFLMLFFNANPEVLVVGLIIHSTNYGCSNIPWDL